VVVGDCFKNVSYDNFLNLLEVATPRVNLEIDNVDVFNLRGAKDARQKPDFIDVLMNTQNTKIIPLI
jgi:hypothetical protein